MKHKAFLLGLMVGIVACSGSTKEQPKEASPRPGQEQPVLKSLEREYIEPVFPEDMAQERTNWQNPDIVLKSFSNLSEKTVADVGAGAGYFSFKLAQVAQKVIALDIDPKALDYIREQKQIVGNWADNIEPRLTPPDVPNLLVNEADAVLVVNTFCFIPNQQQYFERLRNGLKPEGELVIVDFKKGNIPVGPADEMKMDARTVRSILRKAGYKRISIDERSLEYQYIIKTNN